MPRKRFSSRPDHVRAWALFQSGQSSDARRIYEKICRKDHADDGAWLMRGIIQAQQGNYADAEIYLNRAVAINPKSFDAHVNLGLLHYQKNMPALAMKHYENALALNPDHPDLLFQVGNVCARQDCLVEAETYYRRALALNPDQHLVRGNLANVLAYQGRPREAMSEYRHALRVSASSAGIHSNLLLCMHYPHSMDPEAVYAEHKSWAATHGSGVQAFEWRCNTGVEGAQLRIGYVTPDLREHSVAYFLKPLLEHHDRAAFRIFCYFEIREQTQALDSLTELAGTVRNTRGLTDERLAALIREDGIDILVDLAGHTENNRLPVFLRRPAPVQMTYLGYPDTTGLDTIDYRITDQWADPPGQTERLHSEKLLRLENGFLCFSPPTESPAVSPLPFDTSGYITFGSFNVLTKITPEVLELWVGILEALPSARLLVKNRQLTDPNLQQRLRDYFLRKGLDAARIELLGRTSKSEHMATYGRVDIALDTFPYNGTTTTCDTLWMGIPVVSMAGASHVSRVGASLLTQVGLDYLIAENSADYVACAVSLAQCPRKIRQLRNSLREVMRGSTLCDGEGFCRLLEAGYRSAWRTWKTQAG